jgi:hypothetical protein
MAEIIAPIRIAEYSGLSGAEGKASELRANLQSSSNPILVVHPSADSYTAFSNLVS